MRANMSTWPELYCSITSLTSYGRNASLNLRRATKYLILRRARMARLWTSVRVTTRSISSSSAG